MASKKTKGHACAKEINALLEKQGDCLQRFISLRPGGPEKFAIVTERKDTTNWKRGATWLLASYCPFCGVDLRPATKPDKRRSSHDRVPK